MSGTVTVLFTDLVGSIELLAQLGDDAMQAVRRTRLALARVLLQRSGAGDRERARALLDQVVGAAAAMGMAGVERDARALLT
ncbi:MAG: hypothetical protein HYR72_20030 [Deltaproteobacteria bacterium]|nr:hypothetical protein [Deltaproteobacteria bacterium]MBI3390833.1 hypothetical protein [Deltaproteobacteria bacterium]